MPRPQDKNLKPYEKGRSKEEAVRAGRKGGIASGEARRKKKSMKESFEALFAMQATDQMKQPFKKAGYDVEDLTNEQALVLSMTRRAIAGDARMASLIMDICGEKHSDKLKAKELELKEKQATDTKNEALDRLDEILRGLHEQAENDAETK